MSSGRPGGPRGGRLHAQGTPRSSPRTPSRSPDPSSRRRSHLEAPEGAQEGSEGLEERRHETRQPADRAARSHADAPHGAELRRTGRPLLKDEEGRPLTEEHARYAEARDRLAVFAELEKSPDYLHTYRLGPVSVWNAAALGVSADEILATLEDLTCVPIPNIEHEVRGWVGALRHAADRAARGGFELVAEDRTVVEDVLGHDAVRKHCTLGPEGQVWTTCSAASSSRR